MGSWKVDDLVSHAKKGCILVVTKQPTYPLDLDSAKAAIRQFNSSAIMLASEKLMLCHFPNLRDALYGETVAEQVVLLDGLWGTQLFRQPGAADLIASNLSQHSQVLIELLDGLGDNDLEHAPERVFGVSTRSFRYVYAEAVAPVQVL